MLNRLKKVFSSFQNYEVKYLVIGGVASVLYGVPRATFDLDILIEATEENADKLLRALLDAGMATADLTNPKQVLENEITIFTRNPEAAKKVMKGVQIYIKWNYNNPEEWKDYLNETD